ncbi:MAG TPA: hypothetical protein PLP11_07430 [Bacteroidales bacterium]|nr:hypothetical protein [Bacteroidales bacterium]
MPTPDEYTEIVWTVSTLNIPGGARTPKRIATTVETWQEEVAELTLALIDAPGNIPLNIPTFINTLEQAAPDTGWVNLAMSSGWSFSAEDRPQLRVRNGAAYLRGFVTRDGSTTGIIGVVPSVYRPSRDMSLHDGSIVISASGNITETEAFVDNVSLDDIMWVI